MIGQTALACGGLAATPGGWWLLADARRAACGFRCGAGGRGGAGGLRGRRQVPTSSPAACWAGWAATWRRSPAISPMRGPNGPPVPPLRRRRLTGSCSISTTSTAARPPRRVVEVLEAAHLMLALELFVVVVAVDA